MYLAGITKYKPVCCRCPVSAQTVVHEYIAQQPETLVVRVVWCRRVPEVNITLCHLVGTFTTAQDHRVRFLAYVP